MTTTVTELSIQLTNEAGSLAAVSAQLGDAGINIIALFVSTTTPGGAGLMRFVPDNPERAESVLTAHGSQVSTCEVLAAETPHKAGGLQAILNPLQAAGINVAYVYPCILQGANSILILGADGPLDAAATALDKHWIRLYGSDLYAM